LKATDAALGAVANAARENHVYVVTGLQFVPEGWTRPHQRLYLFSPAGETLLVYDKVWHASQFDAPKLASIDGVLCGFILCADRWSKPVESLPPVMGAQILFECSNNFDTEWIPSLEWYWYVPRAVRNTACVIFSNAARENRFEDSVRGHGHSAIVAPDGSLLVSAGDERDKIISADLDLSKATREMAIRRSQHPLFKDWWEMGQKIHRGEDFTPPDVPSLVSSENGVKAGFGLMACSSSIEDNLNTIRKLIGDAARNNLDLIVFPELAVTGDRNEDIRAAKAPTLAAAVEAICAVAAEHKIAVVFGSPTFVQEKRRNSAYVVGPDGAILTRYDQIVVSRPDLFEGGLSTRSMWFQINGLWSVVSIGEGAIGMKWLNWQPCAAPDCTATCATTEPDGRQALFHEQLVANLASHRTLTIVANPLHPELSRNTRPVQRRLRHLGRLGGWRMVRRQNCQWPSLAGCFLGTTNHSRAAESHQAERGLAFDSASVPPLDADRRCGDGFRKVSTSTWMKNSFRTAFTLIAMLGLFTPGLHSQSGPFDGKRFQGRIAYSADGNHNDPDDWAASPLVLALIAAAGAKEQLIHFDYNCILPNGRRMGEDPCRQCVGRCREIRLWHVCILRLSKGLGRSDCEHRRRHQ
jgi:predicted amidohydrolase